MRVYHKESRELSAQTTAFEDSVLLSTDAMNGLRELSKMALGVELIYATASAIFGFGSIKSCIVYTGFVLLAATVLAWALERMAQNIINRLRQEQEIQ